MKHVLNYKLIEKAVSGDEVAINKIVTIYQPYINTLSAMTLYDDEGNEYVGINIDLQDHLTRKLLELIHTYKIA